MRKLKWVRFWMSDWRSGTASLYAVEYTLYHKICQEIWETGRGVEDADIERLMLDPPAQVRAALETLVRLGKLRLEDGRYVNGRSVEMHDVGMNEYSGRMKGGANSKKKVEEPKERSVRGADKTEYPEWFEALWSDYPDRGGASNPKKDAYSCAKARVKEGEKPEVMMAGLKRYTARMEAKGDIGTDLVMQAKRFFGKNREYLNEWPAPKTAGQQRQSQAEAQAQRLLQKRRERHGVDGSGVPAGHGGAIKHY